MCVILQFPNRENPSPDDIVILMRAAIKIGYQKVVDNNRAASDILSACKK